MKIIKIFFYYYFINNNKIILGAEELDTYRRTVKLRSQALLVPH